MDLRNKSTYKNLTNRYNNQGDQEMVHDEEAESGMVDELRSQHHLLKKMYLRSVLNPESHIAKIPSRLPVDSAVAPLKYNFNITPNASGLFLLVLDPFYRDAYLYQDATTNGTGAGVVSLQSFAQDATIIDQWRLVSASVILKYYGNFNQLGGYIVAATTSNVTAATQTTYLTFNNIEDLSNKQVMNSIDGVKVIFTPQDEKATDFNTATTYTAGTHPSRWQNLIIIYGASLPNIPCIRVDYFRNIEYCSTAAYKEYIPQNKDAVSSMPNVSTTKNITPAPVDFSGSSRRPAATSFIDHLFDTGINVLGNMFSNSIPGISNSLYNINPFADLKKGF